MRRAFFECCAVTSHVGDIVDLIKSLTFGVDAQRKFFLKKICKSCSLFFLVLMV